MPKEHARFNTGSEPAPVGSKPNMEYGESFTAYFERMHREQQRDRSPDISNDHPAAHDAGSRGSSISSNSTDGALLSPTATEAPVSHFTPPTSPAPAVSGNKLINRTSLTEAPSQGSGRMRPSESPLARHSPQAPIHKLGDHKRKAGNDYRENDVPAPKRSSRRLAQSNTNGPALSPSPDRSENRGEAFRLVAEYYPLLRAILERRYDPLEIGKGKHPEGPPELKAEKLLHRKRNPSVIGAVPQNPTGLIGNNPTFRHSPMLAKRGDVLMAIAKGDPLAETMKKNYDKTSRGSQQKLNTRSRNDGRGVD